MDLVERLQEQIDTVRVPLFAVTVIAATQADTPLIALLPWRGFRRATPLVLPSIEIAPRPIPLSVIPLNFRWCKLEAADALLLDAAWQFGAWELDVSSSAVANVLGASVTEAVACRQAFGIYELDAAKRSALEENDVERERLVKLAAQGGYIRWLFRL